jgi:hypothetical protein
MLPMMRRAAPCVVGVAVLSLVAALLGALPSPAEARTNCGKINSTSTYEKAKITAIRGVSCDKAIEIARRFDHKGKTTGKWECFLAHGGGTRLFSCGKGDDQGDVRDWPHALTAKGVK